MRLDVGRFSQFLRERPALCRLVHQSRELRQGARVRVGQQRPLERQVTAKEASQPAVEGEDRPHGPAQLRHRVGEPGGSRCTRPGEPALLGEAAHGDVEVPGIARGELRHLVDGEAAALQEEVGQLPLLQSPQHQARDETILMQEQPSAERGRQHGWRRVLERRFNLPAGCCAATRRIRSSRQRRTRPCGSAGRETDGRPSKEHRASRTSPERPAP